MPRCWPEQPEFTTGSEREVWELLRQRLDDDDLLIANLRVTDHVKDHEIDVAVLMPGTGIVVVEVKGGGVSHDGKQWWQQRHGKTVPIDPVTQARTAKYALRDYVQSDRRWGSRGRIPWAHAVVLPYLTLDDDFALPDCPRWSVIGRSDLDDIVQRLRRIAVEQQTHDRTATSDDVRILLAVLGGRSLPQRDLIGEAAEREDVAEQLTQEQTMILSAIRQLPRVEVRGGAGSGKTWLAVEQARRLALQGERVALLCYSKGLAAFLERRVATLRRRERPAYVGTFHGLGARWGAGGGSDDDSDFWERRLPEQMVELAQGLQTGHRFDAIVIDEAQDFADAWWPVVLSALRDEEAGRLYAFCDEGQRVFSRFGGAPAQLLPILLDHNLRNTRQIAEVFNPLTPIRMRLFGGDGPRVRLAECTAGEALSVADDQVDTLLTAGWRPEDVALLATGSRHPEQVERQGRGQDAYWATFWDTDRVFYGHVLGFKGLERRAVVLAVNESEPRDRSRERLYVGLSRARDELVVCGDPEFLRAVGGEEVLRRLQAE